MSRPKTKADRMAIMARYNQSQGESVDEIYEVESILKKKIENGVEHYLVSWKGYPLSEATWEPKSHMTDCSSLILQYQLSHLPQQAKDDLLGAPSAQPFKQNTDPLPENIFQHNMSAIRASSTLQRCQQQIAFLRKKVEEHSKLPPNAHMIQILGCQQGSGKDEPIWFDVRLQDNSVRRVRKQEVVQQNKVKLAQYYQKLIHWST